MRIVKQCKYFDELTFQILKNIRILKDVQHLRSFTIEFYDLGFEKLRNCERFQVTRAINEVILVSRLGF